MVVLESAVGQYILFIVVLIGTDLYAIFSIGGIGWNICVWQINK